MFHPTEPARLTNQSIVCKLCEVTFEQPVEEVADWSDRQKTLLLNSSKPASAATKQSTTTKVKELIPCQSHPGSQSVTDASCICVSR